MEPEAYIRQETVGGALDFCKRLKNDGRSIYVASKVSYSKEEYAVFLWGEAAAKLGIASGKKAAKLWQELHERKLSTAESKALKNGFDGGLEQ